MRKTATQRVLDAWSRKHKAKGHNWAPDEIDAFTQRMEAASRHQLLEDRRARAASWARAKDNYFI